MFLLSLLISVTFVNGNNYTYNLFYLTPTSRVYGNELSIITFMISYLKVCDRWCEFMYPWGASVEPTFRSVKMRLCEILYNICGGGCHSSLHKSKLSPRV